MYTLSLLVDIILFILGGMILFEIGYLIILVVKIQKEKRRKNRLEKQIELEEHEYSIHHEYTDFKREIWKTWS